MVGVTGLGPAVSWSQARRDGQTSLHPSVKQARRCTGGALTPVAAQEGSPPLLGRDRRTRTADPLAPSQVR